MVTRTRLSGSLLSTTTSAVIIFVRLAIGSTRTGSRRHSTRAGVEVEQQATARRMVEVDVHGIVVAFRSTFSGRRTTASVETGPLTS